MTAEETKGLSADLDAIVEVTDGRRARGQRTRRAVTESFLTLVDEGELHPTAYQVAERAGVVLRTVYHHFDDVEALRRTAFELHLGRQLRRLREVDTALPLDVRVREVTKELRRLFEAITPIRRATLVDEQSSTEMADGVRITNQHRRSYLERCFGRELNAAPDRRVLLDAVDAAASWYHWHFIREALGRSALAAERILGLTLNDLLDGQVARPAPGARSSR